MSVLRKKHSLQRWFFSKITLGILVVLIVFMGISVYERFTVEREMAARRTAAEAELIDLAARKAALEEKVEYLRDERGVEAEIRQHFDVAREGEQVVIIVEDEQAAAAVKSLSLPPAPEPAPWYAFWR